MSLNMIFVNQDADPHFDEYNQCVHHGATSWVIALEVECDGIID